MTFFTGQTIDYLLNNIRHIQIRNSAITIMPNYQFALNEIHTMNFLFYSITRQELRVINNINYYVERNAIYPTYLVFYIKFLQFIWLSTLMRLDQQIRMRTNKNIILRVYTRVVIPQNLSSHMRTENLRNLGIIRNVRHLSNPMRTEALRNLNRKRSDRRSNEFVMRDVSRDALIIDHSTRRKNHTLLIQNNIPIILRVRHVRGLRLVRVMNYINTHLNVNNNLSQQNIKNNRRRFIPINLNNENLLIRNPRLTFTELFRRLMLNNIRERNFFENGVLFDSEAFNNIGSLAELQRRTRYSASEEDVRLFLSRSRNIRSPVNFSFNRRSNILSSLRFDRSEEDLISTQNKSSQELIKMIKNLINDLKNLNAKDKKYNKKKNRLILNIIRCKNQIKNLNPYRSWKDLFPEDLYFQLRYILLDNRFDQINYLLNNNFFEVIRSKHDIKANLLIKSLFSEIKQLIKTDISYIANIRILTIHPYLRLGSYNHRTNTFVIDNDIKPILAFDAIVDLCESDINTVKQAYKVAFAVDHVNNIVKNSEINIQNKYNDLNNKLQTYFSNNSNIFKSN